jgi:hypothetical protein
MLRSSTVQRRLADHSIEQTSAPAPALSRGLTPGRRLRRVPRPLPYSRPRGRYAARRRLRADRSG